MAGINGNVSTTGMQGCRQAPSCWLLAPSKTNPNPKTNPKTSVPPRLRVEIGGRP